MARRINALTRGNAGDAPYSVKTRRSFDGGENTRVFNALIGETQVEEALNADLSIPGEAAARPAITKIDNQIAAYPITGLIGLEAVGQTSRLLISENTNVRKWTGSGSISSALKSDFTSNLKTSFIKAFKTGVGDIALVSNGTDNVFDYIPSSDTFNDLGNTNTSPPKTTVGTKHTDNRVYMLKDNFLYFSSAAPSDFSTAFDRTTNAFKMPVGSERAVTSTRTASLLIWGKEQIWELSPSVTPSASTDIPTPLFTDFGCASGDTVTEVGDDFFWLSFDGVRSVKRTQLDKLQMGVTYPLSYALKTRVDDLNWGAITKACAVYFNNKYIISVPVNGSSTNNEVWVYTPASNGWSVFQGWNIACWAKFKVDGELRLYAGEATNSGIVYRAFSGATDNGSSFTFRITGRNEDLDNPYIRKVGGEIKVVAEPTGDYDLIVRASFDNGGFETLGTFNLSGNLITFPVTFPVNFGLSGEAFGKFHIDEYGPWYRCQLQIENAQTLDSERDLVVREYTIASHLEEYISEEQA